LTVGFSHNDLQAIFPVIPSLQPTSHMSYRPEIDGLRAVAVLSVVLYHFGISGPDGGFVGVDVFFVLSGYLIGGLLWDEMARTGRIGLGPFYLRRIRRLAPAFFVMTFVSAIIAAVILLPFELREFGKEMIAATVWLSNVLYYMGTGYFDIGVENKVFLHTWSLSVEEQFYVVLPLLLLAFRFSRVVLIVVLGLLWLASLIASIWFTPVSPAAAFYLFPFRAWELLSGVLLAIAMHERVMPRQPMLSWIGIVLILVAVMLARPKYGFPGWQAMLPVAGTMMLLFNGRDDNSVNRVLAWPGLVFIGLISYSLYLWHWPVLVLSRYWRGGYAGWTETLGWIAVALVLAVLSWRFVERPIRQSRRITAMPLLAGACAAGLATLAAGSIAFLGNGLPGRFGPEERVHIIASSGFLQDWSRCKVQEEGALAGLQVCAIGPEGPPRVLFWGDSHLRALMDGIGLAASEAGRPGLIVWNAGCPPLFDVTKTESAATPAEDAACTFANDRMHAALPNLTTVSDVVLVGRWAYYANGAGTGRDAHNTILISSRDATGAMPDQSVSFADLLDRTVAEIALSVPRIHVLRQIPEVPSYDSRSVALGLAHGHLNEHQARAMMIVAPETLAARVAASEAAIAPLVASGRVSLIDPWPLLCADLCSVMRDGVSLYFDNNHLNNDGARAIRDLFRPVFVGGDDVS
jgi:peptidoglycan/LPS O-acetylase OafA/YrhL